MESVILPCWIHDVHSYRRYVRWLRYMDKYVQPRLSYGRIILLDNASDLKFLKKLGATVHDEDGKCLAVGRNDLFVYRYHTHYPRIGHLNYPYYWRACYQLPKFKGTFYEANKYYWIDSDVFLLTNEFISHIKNQNTGFIRYKDRHHQWGESILMTINSDSLRLLDEHERAGGGWKNRNEVAEETLPKTLIDDIYNGGRYPETGKQQDDTMHWLGQCYYRYKIKFRG